LYIFLSIHYFYLAFIAVLSNCLDKDKVMAITHQKLSFSNKIRLFLHLKIALWLILSLVSTGATAGNGYTEPAYQYRWAGMWGAPALMNKFWESK
jgi:hypothetical protein